MTWLRILKSRLAALFRKDRLERELGEELRSHLEMLVEENERKGMPPREAHYAARRSFGGVEQVKEVYREQRGLPMIETLVQDLRYGFRVLAKNPGFTTVAELSLAMGIGANCAIFTLVNAVLLKDLPVKDPEMLARVVAYRRDSRRDFSYPVFRDLSSRQQVFSRMAASGELGLNHVILEGAGELQEFDQIKGALVSANYFSLLGVNAILGRVFTLEDSRAPGEGAVAVISYGFWERRFGRDPSVLGRTIFLNGTPFTIIGVAPRRFFGDMVGVARDIWVPILMQPRVMTSNMLDRRTSTWFRTIGRLKPGTSEDRANAELTALFQQIMAEEIATGTGSLISRERPTDFRVQVERGSRGLNVLREPFRQPLQLLMAVVGLVLLIACCNVANLLLARGSARQREIGVRLAIGSGRWRLMRQLLTESILTSMLGGAVGFAMAHWGTSLLVALFAMGGFPLALDLRPDARVLAFTLAVSLLSSILVGLVPALQATSLDLSSALQANSRSQGGSRPRQRLSKALVISQVALSLWLLIGAGLLVRTVQNLKELDIGLARGNVLMLSVLADAASVERANVVELRAQVFQRLKAIPGVRSVSFSGFGLFSGSLSTSPVRVPGSSVKPENDGEVREEWISPEYFQTFGMKLLLGRGFMDQDSENAPKVAVINETTTRHYFGPESPIGKTIYFPKVDSQGRYVPFGSRLDKEQGVQIVGVVQDAKYDNLRDPTPRMVYLPVAQGTGFAESIEVRTTNDPNALAPQIRQVLKQVSNSIVLRSMNTLEEQINGTLIQERLVAKLLGFFGLLALVLACVGLYGVMSYAVVRRTSEIGIRMALGARRTDVTSMVLRETLVLVIAGVALGVPAALASTHLLRSLLFGLTPTDPVTIGAMSVLMLGIAALAGYLPARRAARVDPMVALRHE